jgi:hypothetical protein
MSTLGLLFFACGGGQPPPKTEPGTNAATSATGAPAASSAGDNAPSTTLAVGPSSSGTKLDPTTPATTGGGDEGKEHGKDGGAKKQSEPGRSHEDIRVLIQAHRDEARACYDKALPAHPGLEGDVTMKFTIDPEGNVTSIALDDQRSTILEPQVATCVGDVIKKIKFAKSAKGFETHGHYPFNFHPRAGGHKKDGG